MDSEYMNHHEERIPSSLRSRRFGKGVALSGMSSPGMGATTVSVLLRSIPRPITEVSSADSFSGREALFVSSLTSVMVNNPVVALAASSLANGCSDLVMRPTSVDAVEDTIRTSFRCGL
jgi:hypothetical protein